MIHPSSYSGVFRHKPDGPDRVFRLLFLAVSVTVWSVAGDWVALGHAIVRRRTEIGMRTATALAKRMGYSARLVADLETGRRDSYAKSTLLDLAQALDWPPDSVERILSGESPERTYLAPDKAIHTPGIGEDLPVDVTGWDEPSLAELAAFARSRA